jgi:hypothetical protein
VTDFTITRIDEHGHHYLTASTDKAHAYMDEQRADFGDDAFASDGTLFVENRCWTDYAGMLRDDGYTVAAR